MPGVAEHDHERAGERQEPGQGAPSGAHFAPWPDILQHAPFGAYLRDGTGGFVWTNPALARLLGVAAPEAAAAAEPAGLDPARQAWLRHFTRRALRGETVETELELPTPHGRSLLWIIEYPVLDARGSVVGAGGVVIDVTRREQA